jgi:hypothetical protein
VAAAAALGRCERCDRTGCRKATDDRPRKSKTCSKLKLIKTYLRSTMYQERLSDLAILSIENGNCQELNYTD